MPFSSELCFALSSLNGQVNDAASDRRLSGPPLPEKHLLEYFNLI